jgi:hypothetical protein
VVAFAPPGAAPGYQEFGRSYAETTPMLGLAAPRDSAVPAFYAFLGISEEDAVTTVGTLSQVVSDFGSRVSLLGEQLPNRTAWRSELFLRESGIDGQSLHAELASFNERVERMALVAEGTPDMVDAALLGLDENLALLIDAIDGQRAALIEGLRLRAARADPIVRRRAGGDPHGAGALLRPGPCRLVGAAERSGRHRDLRVDRFVAGAPRPALRPRSLGGAADEASELIAHSRGRRTREPSWNRGDSSQPKSISVRTPRRASAARPTR